MSVDLERLRASLLSEAGAGEFVQEDGGEGLPLTPAAVLFPIVLRDDGHTVLLTQRTAHLRDHAGQISFPGGRVEEEDPSPVATALRETEEEIGLSRAHVEILGFLPEYRTGTGFRVTPGGRAGQAAIRAGARSLRGCGSLRGAPGLPARSGQPPSAIRCITVAPCATFFAMPYGDYFIWGATAGMIRSLTDRLDLHPPELVVSWRFVQENKPNTATFPAPMSLLSLIAVFLIEQLQPLNYRRVVEEPLAAWAGFIESSFDAGEYRHGVIAWCLAVLAPVVLVGWPTASLYSTQPAPRLAAQCRRSLPDHGLSPVQPSLQRNPARPALGDLPRARQLLGEWQGTAGRRHWARRTSPACRSRRRWWPRTATSLRVILCFVAAARALAVHCSIGWR
jgi:8-oxo-dGTP pyrophosphatase MutT (NUDIX family)